MNTEILLYLQEIITLVLNIAAAADLLRSILSDTVGYNPEVTDPRHAPAPSKNDNKSSILSRLSHFVCNSCVKAVDTIDAIIRCGQTRP